MAGKQGARPSVDQPTSLKPSGTVTRSAAMSAGADPEWLGALNALAEKRTLSQFSRYGTDTITLPAVHEVRPARFHEGVDGPWRSAFSTRPIGGAPGRGAADLLAGQIVPAPRGAQGAGGTASWNLPPPRSRAGGARRGGVGPGSAPWTWPVSDADPVLPGSWGRPLTAAERALMKTYFAALRRHAR
jgi:hypothetical protein